MRALIGSTATEFRFLSLFLAGVAMSAPARPARAGGPTILVADFNSSTKDAAPRTLQVGDPIVFTLEIANNSPDPATDAVVTDVFPACLEVPPGWDPNTQVTVSPGPAVVAYNGATRTLTVTFSTFPGRSTQTITINGLAGGSAGQCCNQAFITSTEIPRPGVPTDDPTSVPDDDPTCVQINPPPGSPDFGTSEKDVNPRTGVVTGDPITYTLSVVNSGTGPATNVVVTDVFDACLDVPGGWDPATEVVLSPGPGTASYNAATRTLTVTFASMPERPNPGSTQTVTINGLATAATGMCCNQASIASTEIPAPGQPTDDPDSGAIDDPTCIDVGNPPIVGPDFTTSTKDTADRTPAAGDPVTYQLTIVNSGTAAANQAVITDVFPACLEVPPGWDASSEVVVAPGPATSVSYNASTRTLTINFASFPARPDPAATQTITINGLLAGTQGQCCNQAGVTGLNVQQAPHLTDDPQTGALDDETCIDIQPPVIVGPNFTTSTKDATPRNPAAIGDPVTYTLAIVNSGTAAAVNAVITDVIPPCLTVPGGWDPATQVVVTPGPATTKSYNAGTRTLTITFASFPSRPDPAATQTITINGLLAGSAGLCCNQAEVTGDNVQGGPHVTDDPITPAGSDPTCITIPPPLGPDFSTSGKNVSPRTGVVVGDPLTYTISATNSGLGPAANVVLTDVFDVCLDVPPGWDPATQVVVTPGPATSRTYNAGTRTLTVTFASFAAGATENIQINGLSAASAGSCCNQAAASSDEITIAQPTDDLTTGAPDDPTCVTVTDIPAGLDLLRNDEITTLAPVAPARASIFTASCSTNATLDAGDPNNGCSANPGEITTSGNGSGDNDDLYAQNVGAPPYTDPDGGLLTDANRPLMLWQVEGTAAGNTLQMIKSKVQPTAGTVDIYY